MRGCWRAQPLPDSGRSGAGARRQGGQGRGMQEIKRAGWAHLGKKNVLQPSPALATEQNVHGLGAVTAPGGRRTFVRGGRGRRPQKRAAWPARRFVTAVALLPVEKTFLKTRTGRGPARERCFGPSHPRAGGRQWQQAQRQLTRPLWRSQRLARGKAPKSWASRPMPGLTGSEEFHGENA